jgi:hypothetical protein
MRSWFLRPIINLSMINDRLDAVELLVAAPDLGARIKAILRKVGGMLCLHSQTLHKYYTGPPCMTLSVGPLLLGPHLKLASL